MKNNFKWKTNTFHAKKNMSTLMIIFSEKIEFDQTLFFLDFFCFCQVFFCFRLWLTWYSLTKGTIVDEIK